MSKINYIGISQVFPCSPKYFTETCFFDVFTLPEDCKNINSVLSVNPSINVIGVNLIETPVEISYEGQQLLGYKLIVELSICHKIVYLEYPLVDNSCYDNPALNVDLGNNLKSLFVILPCSICGIDTCSLIRKKAFSVTPYIENMSVQVLDNRSIYFNMDIFINVLFDV